MLAKCSVLCCVCFLPGLRLAASTPLGDATPELEVSLAPPLNPLPELTQAITQQEQLIENARSAYVKELRDAFGQAVRSVRQLLDQRGTKFTRTPFIDVPPSFLEGRDQLLATSVDIEVAAAKPFPNIAPDLGQSLAGPEMKRLRASYANATADLHGLASTLVSAFQRELESQRFASHIPTPPSFFNASATALTASTYKQANVHVTASRQLLPTPASLLEAFAQRLTVNDRLDARHFLDLDMQMCKAVIRMIRNYAAATKAR